MDSIAKPRVTVIIPHRDRASLLQQTVTSVLNSTDTRHEIIIVDDGSSAEEWKATAALEGERVRVIRRNGGRPGPSRCRNLGLAACQSDYVVFLDSDDIMAPWCLENRLKEAARGREVDLLVFPVLLFRHRPGDMGTLWNCMTDEREDAARFVRADPPWHTSSPLWRTDSIRRIGGFNEEVLYGDDADLHLRALLLGLTTCKYPAALPDIFIRRSDNPRITNSLSSALVDSRRIRLREGTRFLKSCPSACYHLRAWEGQYFVEAEFLLFNHSAARTPIRHVLSDWEQEFSPHTARRLAVRGYFALAQLCRRRIYLLLRILRRIVMVCVPADYFPGDGGFQSTPATDRVMEPLRELLASRT